MTDQIDDREIFMKGIDFHIIMSRRIETMNKEMKPGGIEWIDDGEDEEWDMEQK